MSMNDEIKAVQAAARKRIAAIRAGDAKVQLKHDLRVVALLRKEHPQATATLDAAARDELAAEAATRSAAAAVAASMPSGGAAPSGNDDSDAHGNDHDDWSGS